MHTIFFSYSEANNAAVRPILSPGQGKQLFVAVSLAESNRFFPLLCDIVIENPTVVSCCRREDLERIPELAINPVGPRIIDLFFAK